jgi:hypothetical protein
VGNEGVQVDCKVLFDASLNRGNISGDERIMDLAGFPNE